MPFITGISISSWRQDGPIVDVDLPDPAPPSLAYVIKIAGPPRIAP